MYKYYMRALRGMFPDLSIHSTGAYALSTENCHVCSLNRGHDMVFDHLPSALIQEKNLENAAENQQLPLSNFPEASTSRYDNVVEAAQ